ATTPTSSPTAVPAASMCAAVGWWICYSASRRHVFFLATSATGSSKLYAPLTWHRLPPRSFLPLGSEEHAPLLSSSPSCALRVGYCFYLAGAGPAAGEGQTVRRAAEYRAEADRERRLGHIRLRHCVCPGAAQGRQGTAALGRSRRSAHHGA